MSVYAASPTRNRRAAQTEMEAGATFLLAYADKHALVTVRQPYCVAGVRSVPGIAPTGVLSLLARRAA